VGEPVIFSPDLDHGVYSQVLVERMEDVYRRYEEGKAFDETGDLLLETDIAMQNLGAFTANHILFLGEDPGNKALFDDLFPRFNFLENQARGINTNANRARKARADEEAKEVAENNPQLQKVIRDAKLKELELGLEHARKLQDSRNSFSIEAAESQHKMKIRELEAINKAAVDKAKALSSNNGVQEASLSIGTL